MEIYAGSLAKEIRYIESAACWYSVKVASLFILLVPMQAFANESKCYTEAPLWSSPGKEGHGRNYTLCKAGREIAQECQ